MDFLSVPGKQFKILFRNFFSMFNDIIVPRNEKPRLVLFYLKFNSTPDFISYCRSVCGHSPLIRNVSLTLSCATPDRDTETDRLYPFTAELGAYMRISITLLSCFLHALHRRGSWSNNMGLHSTAGRLPHVSPAPVFSNRILT